MGSIITVLSAAPSIDLTILATAKEELGIADASQDTLLARWIHETSQQIATYCGRILGRQTVLETWHLNARHIWRGEAWSEFQLRFWPVATMSTVTEDDVALVEDTDFTVDYDRGLLARLGGRHYARTVTASYQAGYQLLQELPHDLERACLLLLRYRYGEKSRNITAQSESLQGVYSVVYTSGSQTATASSLPEDVAAILAPYRDVGVA